MHSQRLRHANVATILSSPTTLLPNVTVSSVALNAAQALSPTVTDASFFAGKLGERNRSLMPPPPVGQTKARPLVAGVMLAVQWRRHSP